MLQKVRMFSRNICRSRRKVTLILVPLLLLVTYSCRKEIRPEKGGLDLISNVYLDASKGLDKVQNFHISRMNYSGSNLIELIPDLTFPEVTENIYYIKDSFQEIKDDGACLPCGLELKTIGSKKYIEECKRTESN